MEQGQANLGKGVALVMAAVFLFALGDVLGKHLMTLYPVPFVQAGRYGVNLGLVLILMAPRHGAALWKADRLWLLLLRGALLACASMTMGYALRLMPVGETVAISYLAPFLLMLLSAPILGEKVPLAAWIGAAVAFAGVLAILRPGAGLDPVGVGFALANAALAAGYMLTTRLLTRSETTMAMQFYVAFVGSVLFGVLTLTHWPAALPDGQGFALILLLGCLASTGHFLFTLAFRQAPAATLAPVNYVHLVWAGLLGWVFFQHRPDLISLIGMAMVLVAGMGLAFWTARPDRKVEEPSP